MRNILTKTIPAESNRDMCTKLRLKVVLTVGLSVLVFMTLAVPAADITDCIMLGKTAPIAVLIAWYGITFAFFYGVNAAQVLFVKNKVFPVRTCIIYGVVSIMMMASSGLCAFAVITICFAHTVYICMLTILAVRKIGVRKMRQKSLPTKI